MNPPPTDDALGAEQSRWFLEEVHPHDGHLRNYVRGAFPTIGDVDDVVQESYLRILKARVAHPIDCARGFLFRVARNVALNLCSRRKASPVFAVEDLHALPVVDDRPGVAESACTREELKLLAHAIDALPSRCREIVILRRVKNIPQKEIAALLGISESTVEVQVFRGVKRCAEYLQRHGLRFPR